MTALLDWANYANNDLDMYMGGLEDSESGSRFERDIFGPGGGSDEWDDGTYTVEIGIWTAADADIPWKIFFVHPDQQTISSYEGTLTGLALGTGVNANVPIVSFTKTTDPDSGDVSYTFTQL